ncbi:MAG: uroporphyrinogen-III C-methyltransferase, partial [Eggerthellaceae bacterium]|nr:uroporphyrinogen-III C-methyltransferase [Eggerthellaceae bacterium]
MERQTRTKVYLVGAGPGDNGLITVKGLDLLRRADVVIYDYLSDGDLLSYVSDEAQCIHVGKKGFSNHITQDEINKIIVDAAKRLDAQGGGTIVRLKGGDPFVFGRGGEEALACKRAQISFEIVPGVTSGVAAPAYAGIPVTHRGVSSAVTFVTGNEDPTKASSAIDWQSLANLCMAGSTLCFYMGVKNLSHIVASLAACGLPTSTPAALVQWGTKPIQRTLVTTLQNITSDAAEKKFSAPCIIVVGQVAALRDDIAWFEDKPLFGCKVVVTRSRTQASQTRDMLQNLGAQVVELPTIQIMSYAGSREMNAAIKQLGSYDWVLFTSVNGVESFFETLYEQHKDARSFAQLRVAAIGPATADRLKFYGINADVVPSQYRAEAVVQALRDAGISAGDRVLLPRAEEARDVVIHELSAEGIEVDVVPAYKTVVPRDTDAAYARDILTDPEVFALTFASSSTAKNLATMIGKDFAALMNKKTAYSIGPITSQTLRDLGVEHIVEADTYTIDGLVEALQKTYS